MIIIRCPYCREQRTEEELAYGGEAAAARPLESQHLSDEQWTDYLFMRANPKALLAELWCCSGGCAQWFRVFRNTATHEIRGAFRLDRASVVPRDRSEVG